MKTRILLLSTLAGCLGAAAPAGSELDDLAGRWIALRTELAKETAAWAEQGKTLREELALLEAERDQLRAKITTAAAEPAPADPAAAARETALARALAAAPDALRAAEKQLRDGLRPLPPELGEEAARLLDALPETDEAARGLSSGERLQRVVAALTLLETLQNEIQAVQATIETGGTRRVADVLYLGLSRGFAVSVDNAWAAVGTPGDNGWTWTERPELAPAVRQAVRVARREETAKFVSLPLQADEGKGEGTP